MQDFDCVQVRVSGFKSHYQTLLPADSHENKRSKEKRAFGPILNQRFLLGWRSRHHAKSVTSLFTLLSVLGAGVILILSCRKFVLAYF